MEKYIYDESNGLWYELKGDYYFPCWVLENKQEPIGTLGTTTSAIYLGKMNEIQARAREIVNAELIFN